MAHLPPDDPWIRELGADAFRVDGSGTKTLAMLPGHVDTRMLLQQSAFTIHGTSDPLDGLEGATSTIVKTIIPSDSKSEILEHLNWCGIRRSTLFPDLESLSHDLTGFSFQSIDS